MAFFSKPQSTAVKIVRPTTEADPVKQPQPLRKDSIQRQCRNIVIYGHCKYQDKGCTYSHPNAAVGSLLLIPPNSHTLRPASPHPRSDSPVTSTLNAHAVNAPVFVPKFATRIVTSPSPPLQPPPLSSDTVSSTAASETDYSQFEPSDGLEKPNHEYDDRQEEYGYPTEYDNAYEYQTTQAGNELQGMETADPNYYDQSQVEYHPGYEHGGMEAAYYNAAPVYLRQPLDYLLYTPYMPPELSRNTTNSHFVPASNDLRQLLQERSETVRGVAPIGLALPEELQGYHTFVPLEPSGANVERRKIGNWHTTVYRAIRTIDGLPYVLRRVENFRMTHQAAFAPIEIWSQIQHPSIASVREAFTTRSFNDNSLVVVYAYYPNAKTLYDAHIKPQPPAYQQPVYYGRHQQMRKQQQAQHQMLPERTLWSYITQLASAIKAVHERGQAVRMLDVTKILVTGQNRLRIGSCGIIDVLLHDTPQDMLMLQQEDLIMFGRVIFALCCNNVGASNAQHLQTSIGTIERIYTVDVKKVAVFLIGNMPKTIDQVLDMIRVKVLLEHDEALMATDRLEHEILGELENARLVRLMCKFGFINERPEFARDQRWSETGDRYIIKLFRDYVFHQVDAYGNPVLDLSHVLTCLNKLDAGTDEQVMLVARDEQSCLVVSYKEIKACISAAFR
ncbi:hypothetical protein B0H34DRAFT_720426 [Crassisporium funariophilum]|nr:hypothetical protein B0H34DRAFT_720426 [Crassisporium funariophilum]